ncbi:thiamine pyrophosphate-dependent enzyme [Streptomyces sp. NPDC055400]
MSHWATGTGGGRTAGGRSDRRRLIPVLRAVKSFAVLEETPGVPGLDLPGLDIASVARGFGCHAVDVKTTEDLEREFKAALAAGTTTVIVVATQPQKAML